MRNLLQYPVTKQEIIDCLTELSNTVGKTDQGIACGDMRPTLLQEAIKIIENVKEYSYEL